VYCGPKRRMHSLWERDWNTWSSLGVSFCFLRCSSLERSCDFQATVEDVSLHLSSFAVVSSRGDVLSVLPEATGGLLLSWPWLHVSCASFLILCQRKRLVVLCLKKIPG
jgi:hypothetical protein